MSHASRLVFQFERLMAGRQRLLGDSTNVDREDLNSDSPKCEQDTVGLNDLINCPEFMEEQKVLLLEFEAAKLNSQDRISCATSSRHREHRRTGIKLTCPVCLESLSSTRTSYVRMVTECGHVFCQSCIEDVCKAAGEKQALCPVCRKGVGELRKVYF